MGGFNHGNIKWDSQQSTGVEDQQFLCLVQDNFLTQHVLEPTRAARVLCIVLSSQKEFVDNVVIQEPLGSSDHNQLHFNINIKSDKTKVKQCRRDFRRGNYEEISKCLALIDWNDKMNNKTATECWNILRGELDSAIDSYVPMKKQGKRSKKKHLSKEAFRKIRYKQNMWRVYKHTGTDKDYYDAYKEALNAATNEVRKSKRNVEHKLAQNIKSDSKSFYAYVRSKQNVRDKVGPLVDNAGNIITQGFLMAEELNMHFSSVFSSILKFADDTKLLRKVKEIGDTQNLQDDIDKLVKWSEKWQMLFNFGKCKCLHTGSGNTGMNYEMGGTILSKTVKEKDLGVTMNANMKVSEQCRIAASKGNQVLGMIRRNITYKEKA